MLLMKIFASQLCYHIGVRNRRLHGDLICILPLCCLLPYVAVGDSYEIVEHQAMGPQLGSLMQHGIASLAPRPVGIDEARVYIKNLHDSLPLP